MGYIAQAIVLGGAIETVDGAVNLPAAGNKGLVMGGSAGKTGGSTLLVTPEGRVALGGSSTPMPIIRPPPPAPPVASNPTISFEVEGVKLQ